jgi:hypothetical protein
MQSKVTIFEVGRFKSSIEYLVVVLGFEYFIRLMAGEVIQIPRIVANWKGSAT